MAELLVPAVGLGFLWIISKQKKDEGYTNIQKGNLGNTGLIPKNYGKKFFPTKLNNQTVNTSTSQSVRAHDLISLKPKIT